MMAQVRVHFGKVGAQCSADITLTVYNRDQDMSSSCSVILSQHSSIINIVPTWDHLPLKKFIFQMLYHNVTGCILVITAENKLI